MKKLAAALALTLVIALAGFSPRTVNAGNIEMPGIAGNIEMPGLNGNIEMPGAQPTPTPKEEETTNAVVGESLLDWLVGFFSGN